MKNILLFMIVLSILIGCSPSSIYLEKEYKGQRYKANFLSIQPFTIGIKDINDKTNATSFGFVTDIEKAAFDSSLLENFKKLGMVDTVLFVRKIDDTLLSEKEVRVKKNITARFNLPNRWIVFSELTENSDYLIFFQDCYLYKDFTDTTNLSYKVVKYMDANFVLWDNNKHKVVSSGYLKAMPSYWATSIKDQMSLFAQYFCKNILNDSPFTKETYDRVYYVDPNFNRPPVFTPPQIPPPVFR